MTEPSEPKAARSLPQQQTEEFLLLIVSKLAKEMQPYGNSPILLSLDSSLEQDLGLDSLCRLELAYRLEQTFQVHLTEEEWGSAETIGDILYALETVKATVRMPTLTRGLCVSGQFCRPKRTSASHRRSESNFKPQPHQSKKNLLITIMDVMKGVIKGASLRTASYSLYTRTLFGLAIPPLWLASVLLPNLKSRRSVVSRISRFLLKAAGIPLHVHGIENLHNALAKNKKGMQCRTTLDAKKARTFNANPTVIIAANHSSYLDGITLTAFLPPEFCYVVKRELETNTFKRIMLRRLGTIFVERFDTVPATKEVAKIVNALIKGNSVAIFPEGTFQSLPGLLPFRMGAFVAAAKTGAPVIPVAICGTRSILNGNNLLLQHGKISVSICAPLRAHSSSWSAALELRNSTRTAILERCNEPDLAFSKSSGRSDVY